MATWAIIDKIDDNKTDVITFDTKRALMNFAELYGYTLARKNKYEFMAVF